MLFVDRYVQSYYIGSCIGTKIDDLEWPWAAISLNFLGIPRDSAYLGVSYTAKQMKMLTHIVSDNIVAH